MKRRRVLLALAVALVTTETAWLIKRQADIDAGRTRLQKLTDSLRQQERTQVELADSLRELEAEISEAQAKLVKSPRDQLVIDWNSRLEGIKAMFDRDPSQAIPEMQLLTALDWLGLARTAKLDDDTGRRSVLAAIRNVGRNKFARLFGSALTKYEEEHDWLIPTTPAAVAPYLTAPISADVYSRYQVVLPGPVAASYGGYTAIVESGSPIDEQFDLRAVIGASGPAFTSSSGAFSNWAVVEFQLVSQRAQIEFAKANNRRITSANDLIPYVDSPVFKTLMEAEAAFRGDNPGGHSAPKLADLEKYLPTAESRALAAKILAH